MSLWTYGRTSQKNFRDLEEIDNTVNQMADDWNSQIKKQSGKKTIIPWGDSITNQNFFEDATVSQYRSAGFLSVANLELGNYFNILNNAGVSGDNTTQMLARFDADIKTYNPDYVTILGGSNDLIQGVDLNIVKQNLVDMVDLVFSINSIPVLCTVPANNLLSSISDWAELNRWIVDYSNSSSIICVDFADSLTDPNNVIAPYMISGVTYDGLHPNAQGAYYMGIEWASSLRGSTNKINELPSNPSDPNNFVVNPLNSGTGGVVDSEVTGLAPDDSQVFINNSLPVGTTMSCDVVDVDNKRRFNTVLNGTLETSMFFRFNTNAIASSGKKYYAIAEIDIEATEIPVFLIQLRYRNDSTTVFTTTGMKNFADNAQVSNMKYSGVIATPVYEAPANTDGFILDVFLDAVTANVSIGRIAVLEAE